MCDDLAIVSFAESPQGKVVDPKMVDACLQSFDVGANYIEVDMVKSTGAGSSPEVQLVAAMVIALGDTGRVVEKLCEVVQRGFSI